MKRYSELSDPGCDAASGDKSRAATMARMRGAFSGARLRELVHGSALLMPLDERVTRVDTI